MSDGGFFDLLGKAFLESEGEGMTRSDQWHLDKRVIVALIFGFLTLASGGVVQTVYFTSLLTEWKTVTDDRIDSLEKSDEGQQEALKKYDQDQQASVNRLTILEQQFTFIRSDLAEIKDLLKRQIPPTSP